MSHSKNQLMPPAVVEVVEGGCGAAVCVVVVDRSEMDDAELRALLEVARRAESKLAAITAGILVDLSRLVGAEQAQRVARGVSQSSSRQARQDVVVAEKLAELPETYEALADGVIPASHARLIARAAGEGPVDESALVVAAQSEDYTRFNKTVRRHQQDMSTDDGQAILDNQKERRTARAFESKETGMFVLSGEFDPLTGARIATVLSAKERELWHQEDPKKRRTSKQRMADALAELILEPEKGQGLGNCIVGGSRLRRHQPEAGQRSAQRRQAPAGW